MMPAGNRHCPLVLAGAGHAHLVALRRWIDAGWRAPAGSVLLSPDTRAWYSGMMPGLIAGRFAPADCAIDLQPLCAATGISLHKGSVQSLDPVARVLGSGDGQLSFDILSINTGSCPPAPAANDGSIPLVPAKPFPAFTNTWESWRHSKAPGHITLLGSGAAAFELALALRASLPESYIQLIGEQDLLAGHPAGVARRARRILRKRGIGLETGPRIDRIRDGHLCAGSRSVVRTEALILASGAAPLPWYESSGLPRTNGFFTVSETLQSTGDRRILAAGDSMHLPGAKRSGVYAVRQGPVLAENLRALLQGGRLQAYHPRQRSLALLSTADGGALLSYGGWSAGGRLPGLWKDQLDLGFMKRHRL